MDLLLKQQKLWERPLCKHLVFPFLYFYHNNLRCLVNIWDALEDAGKLILKETGTQTVSIVETKYVLEFYVVSANSFFRYGAHAAEVTKEGMKVTGDIIQTAYNIDQLGVKKIAKKAASRTGQHTGTLTTSLFEFYH